MSRAPSWLNRNVAGMCLTSLFADMCYEMVLAVLPAFTAAIGVAAAALGWIEGGADALASFVKLASGWYADRASRRKPVVSLGYLLSGTALSVLAAASSWPLILLGRMVAWFGKGIRAPLRDSLLSEAASPESRGKVFGLHRAADTAGAVLGPLVAVWLLSMVPRADATAPYRRVFLISLIPGLMAFAMILLLVGEQRQAPQPRLALWGSVRALPPPFTRWLRAVGVFGLGDFSHTLLVLAAAQLLVPHYGSLRAGQIAALLYGWHNAVYALAAFPAGALADRIEKRTLLAIGYGMGAAMGFGVAALFAVHAANLPLLIIIFAWSGAYVGLQKPLEAAITADLVPAPSRGTGYGLLGSVNGVGDLAASAVVGTLWTHTSPQAAFFAAGLLMLAGTALVIAPAASPK